MPTHMPSNLALLFIAFVIAEWSLSSLKAIIDLSNEPTPGKIINFDLDTSSYELVIFDVKLIFLIMLYIELKFPIPVLIILII